MKPLPAFVGTAANDNFRGAAKAVGQSRTIQRVWDHNSKGEFDHSAVAVFAIGNDGDKLRLHAYDVGAMF